MPAWCWIESWWYWVSPSPRSIQPLVLKYTPGMLLEVVEIPLLAAEEERDAVVRAGNDQRDAPGGQPHQAVAAQAVAQQHGFVLRLVDRGQHLGQPRRHAGLADVVQSLGQELDIDLVDRSRHGGAQLAVEDFAGNEFQMQSKTS